MAEPTKDPRAASLAALDDGWGDLLDAAPPPTVASPPIPTFADDDLVAADDDASAEDAIPLPTPVPLRTRVPTKPVLRGIRDESQPIDVLTIVRDVEPVEPSDGIPRPVVDDSVARPMGPPEIEPIAMAESAMRLRAPMLASITLADDALPPIVDDDDALPPIVDDDEVVRAPIAAQDVAIAAVSKPMSIPVSMKAPMPVPARAQSSSRRTLWFGVTGVAALLAVGIVATRSDGDTTTPPPAAPVAGAAVHPTAPRDAAPRKAEPAPIAAAVAPTPVAPPPIAPPPIAPPPIAPAPEPAAPEAAAPPPVAVAPVAAPPPIEPTPPPDEAPANAAVADAQAALDKGEFARAHELARAVFKLDRDNEATRIMALAACQLDDGALARDAYRSLAGPRTRTEVFTLCRERDVDVRAKTKGYTPRELLAKARRMAELGDPAQAYELARDSNREHRSAAALELMGICACKMKSAEKAGYVAGFLSAEARQRIADECTKSGVDLPAEG